MSERAYAIGDLVRATQSIFEGPSEDSPGGEFCKKGDILQIRRITGANYPYAVAHPHREPGAGFCVKADEITPHDA